MYKLKYLEESSRHKFLPEFLVCEWEND